MERIVGYARESTMDQAHNGFNMDDQERRIREFCEFEHGDVPYQLTICREEGCSGKDLERPEIQKILQQAEDNEIDTVVIYCLDRLTRCLTDLYDLLERFKRCNVSLISISDRIDTSTPMGRFFVSVIVLIAQWELDTLSSRTARGIEESLQQGNYAKGKIPFGFHRSTEDVHQIMISYEEAEIVRHIFQEIAADNESCYTMGKKMREEKILGRSWTEAGIKQIIKNPLYYGCLQTKEKSINGYIIPIVSKEIWDKANEVISSKLYERKEYLYGDKIICSCCKLPMDHVCTTKRKTGKTYLYYKCPKCRGTINEEKITENIHDTMNYIAKVTYCNDELEVLNDRYQRTGNEMKRLTYAVVHQGIDCEYAKTEADHLHQKQMQLGEQIQQIADKTKLHYYIGLNKEEQMELISQYVKDIEITFTGRKCQVIYSQEFEQIEERRKGK